MTIFFAENWLKFSSEYLLVQSWRCEMLFKGINMNKIAVFTCATLLPLLSAGAALAGNTPPSQKFPIANSGCRLLQNAIASNTVPKVISQETEDKKEPAAANEEVISGTVVSNVGDVVTLQLDDGSLRHLQRSRTERLILGNISGTKVSATDVYCSRLTLYKAPVPEIPTSGTVKFIEVPPERPLLPQVQTVPPPTPAPQPIIPQTW
jgi:hypothetical protein